MAVENDEKWFSFQVKALFVLKIFKFLSWLFGCVEKQFDKKTEVNLTVHDVTDWQTNNYNAHISQYFRREWQSGNDICSVNRI